MNLINYFVENTCKSLSDTIKVGGFEAIIVMLFSCFFLIIGKFIKKLPFYIKSLIRKESMVQKLEKELDIYTKKSFNELEIYIDKEPITVTYNIDEKDFVQIEIQFFYEDNSCSSIVVTGSVDDGGWRAWFPINRSFIKNKP